MNFPSARGFTLAELLVVVSIISVLTTSAMVGGINLSRRGYQTAVGKELDTIAGAVQLLNTDTGGKLPGGIYTATPQNCPLQNHAISLSDTCSGIWQNHPGIGGCMNGNFNSGSFNTWNGPYIRNLNALMDPWGRHYWFDPHYRCHTYVSGCENLPNEQWVNAVVSAGPNGVIDYGPLGNHGAHQPYPDFDNIVRIICVTPTNN